MYLSTAILSYSPKIESKWGAFSSPIQEAQDKNSLSGFQDHSID